MSTRQRLGGCVRAWVAACLLVAASGARAAGPVELRMEMAVHVPLVEVSVAGEGLTVIVDTGAGTTVLDAARGDLLRGKKRRPISITGAGRTVEGQYVEEVVIEAGGRRSQGVPVALLPLETLSRQVGRRVDGILGSHFLGQFVVEMDYAGGKVRLHEAGSFRAPEGWRRVKLEMEGGRPAVGGRLTVVEGRTVSGLFLLDSGSNATVTLLPGAGKRWGMPPGGAAVVEDPALGVAGVSRASLFEARELEWGGMAWRGPLVRVREEGGGGADGLIGGEQLRRQRLAIDYGGKSLWLAPEADRGRPVTVDLAGLRIFWLGENYDRPRIEEVFAGRAGERAGLRAGDVIEAMGGVETPRLRAGMVAEWVRREGTELMVTVRRNGERVERVLQLEALPLMREAAGERLR